MLQPQPRVYIVLAAALSCYAVAAAQNRDAPVKKNYGQNVADERARPKGTKVNPLIDHGGTVLPASRTYAIYWGTTGDFPVDLQSGMASLLSGFNGSSYLGIAQQYMRGA